MCLGKYPAVSLSQARKLRDAAKEQLSLGKNPIRERNDEKLRKMREGQNTFEKIARNWLETK